MTAGVSLMDGWLPLVIQLFSGGVLGVAALRWPARRRVHWIPPLLIVGVFVGAAARWVFGRLGLASEPAPERLWVWVGLTATAAGMALVGWFSAGWTRHNLAAFAASLCLLSVGVTVNTWIGYFPTVGVAWSQLASRPLPGETDETTAMAMRQRAEHPERGALLAVDTGTVASGFAHRAEYVYLPPAWFSGSATDRSAVMMIGGQFNTPADWIRAGEAVLTLDAFAADHAGEAPIAVFVDSNGSFGNDTECVNGTRGRAADHLTGDVIPYVAQRFGVGRAAADWAVAGFSAGGTCAVGLAVKHPELFGTFLDIGGDIGPNSGTKVQTIDRLYGGDADAWAASDPATVIAGHDTYRRLSGRFVVPTPAQTGSDSYLEAANTLCRLGRSRGIDCEIVTRPGRHVWPFAAEAFADSLPWLAEHLAGS